MKIETTINIDPTHILVEAGVRYWEDATVNGVQDEDGKLIPGRSGDLWKARLNLAEGRVEDWPAGTTADIHYKVCDAGEYWLLDSAGKRLAHLAGYVPDAFICHGDNGYGDYIIMSVGTDGKIANYHRPEVANLSDGGWELL